MTTGLLVGIGETREERVKDLQGIARLHRRYGHIQEVIIQNFCAKPGTLMADAEDAALSELLWTIAQARVILPADVSVQAPPNLSPGQLGRLIEAGINDWGVFPQLRRITSTPRRPGPACLRCAGRQPSKKSTCSLA